MRSASLDPAIHSLTARGLWVKTGGFVLLDTLSLSARQGELIGIIGPSGAGKSTLVKALCGFKPAHKGRVLFNQSNLYQEFDRFRQRIGYVPQDDIIHLSLSVQKTLQYAAQLRLGSAMDSAYFDPYFDDAQYKSAGSGHRKATSTLRQAQGIAQLSTSQQPSSPTKDPDLQSRIEGILAALELTERKHVKVRRLSGGQRKRVSIGVELVTSPEILFLDEPTSGLDPGLEAKLMALLKKLATEGRMIFVTTHVMKSLEMLDLVLVMVQGKLAYFGPPQEVAGYFEVESFSSVFEKLSQRRPEDWKQRFLASPLHARHAMRG